MWVRKSSAGSAPGFTWEGDGQVIEVPDEFAMELIAIPDGGFSEVAEPVDVQNVGEPVDAVSAEVEPEAVPAPVEAPARKPRTRAPRTVADPSTANANTVAE